ncbi:MAG: ABC transporter permease [Actinobacteria bacterium]|nr:ABC transporter permease [Actinomycetota bacterium]
MPDFKFESTVKLKGIRFKSLQFLMKILDDYLVWILVAIMLVIIAFSLKGFFSVPNISSIIMNSTSLGLLVIAASIPLLAGQFDISIESTFGFCAMLGAILVVWLKTPPFLAILLVLITGALIGFFNGVCVSKIGVNSFMQTLAMLIILRGLMTIILGGGKYISEFPEGYTIFGNTSLFGIPTPIIILFIFYIIFSVILGFRSFGRQLYAVGINPLAAWASGINVSMTQISAFTISGVVAAFAGLVHTTRFVKVDSSLGEGMIFFAVAAAVIGGISIYGGKGNMLGALGGVFFIGIITSILAWFRLQPTIVNVLKGGLILFAVILDAVKNKIREQIK